MEQVKKDSWWFIALSTASAWAFMAHDYFFAILFTALGMVLFLLDLAISNLDDL